MDGNVDHILYSPRRNRPVRKDENMTIFEKNTEILRSFPLKFKDFGGKVRHLQDNNVNTILTDQSEKRISTNTQVKLNLNIDSSKSRNGEKDIKEIDISRPNSTIIYEVSAKNIERNSDGAPGGRVPPFEPKIERHSREMEGADGGIIPPPLSLLFRRLERKFLAKNSQLVKKWLREKRK